MPNQEEHRGSVLILDDMSNWCDTLRLILEQDYYVECVDSLPAAEQAIDNRVFDLLILDIRLTDDSPRDEGMHFLRHMRNLGDQTEVIILTAFPEVQTIREALTELGARDYFFKSPEAGFDQDDLKRFRESVRQAIDASRARASACRLDYSRSILLVEDEKEWASLLSQALTAQGFVVQIAKRFQDAKGLIEERRRDNLDPYRLAVIDLELDEDVSLEVQAATLLNMIIRQSPGTDIVVVTAYPSPRRVRDAFRKYKVRDFFSKDEFDLQDFIQVVRASFEEVWERFIVAWLEENVKGRPLKVGHEYSLQVTCQEYRSSAYEYVPFWLPTPSRSVRLRVVVYAQDMDVKPSISQSLDINPLETRARPLQFRLSPRQTGSKRVVVDLYDEDRLLAMLQFKPVDVVSNQAITADIIHGW